MARQIRGGLPEYGYQAEGAGLRKGVVLVCTTSNTKAKIAAALGAGKIKGILLDEGTLPDGALDPTVPDMANAQKTGIAQALVPAASTAAEGDQAIADATGKVIKRAPFSFSAECLGHFDEGFTAGANPEYRGVELYRHYIETIRSITLLSTGAIGAATRFMILGQAAVNANQFPVYRCRFTGETLRNLALSLKTAPGGADTVIVTFQRSQDGGTTWTDITGAGTPIVTVAAAAIAGDDLVNSFAMTKGDLIAVKLVSSAGTAAQPCVTFDVT